MNIRRLISALFLYLYFTDVLFAGSIVRVGISEEVTGLLDHSGGHLSGPLSSLYECVFERSGLEPQYFSIPLKRGLYYLEKGHLDALIPLARSPERDESLVFAGELIRSDFAYVSFKPLPKISDSESLRFGILRGFVGRVFVPESASRIEEVTHWAQLVPMLERGRVDVSVIPSVMIEDVLGERAKDAFVQKAGELSASMYISPRHELASVSFLVMRAVEACRPEPGVLSSR